MRRSERSLAGLGAGLSIDTLYIAEIAPPKSRGWLVTASKAAATAAETSAA